jgi:uncharacterized membrane protein YhaH (DUF805 family)
MEYFAGIAITLLIYGIVIKKVDSGRCFRYEFIIKTLIIIGLYIISFIMLFIHFGLFNISFFVFLFLFSIPVLMFLSLKYTIQRFYDLDLSGWYILLKLIPVFSLFVTFYLYYRKGKPAINEYDKAIDYTKLFKDRRYINIYDNFFIVDNELYQYERYLKTYTINISKYENETFFSEYLKKNYRINETDRNKTVEMTAVEFTNIIKDLNFVIISNSFYLNINNLKIFIRKENFKYTIILDRNINEISKELQETFNFPGSFCEDERYIYYGKIDKSDLLMWVKTLA